MTLDIRVTGAVQGVGYRPFVYAKATEYGLKGYVKNIGSCVEIMVSGDETTVKEFVNSLKTDYPAGAFILDVTTSDTGDCSFTDSFDDFRIIESSELDLSRNLAVFLPDIGICDDCMAEMLTENDRRYGYPLISCASCGPRISILNKLPYDRDTTTMLDFKMCPKCEVEYKNGRRKHAQTISCHECGPQIELKLYDKDSDSFTLIDKSHAISDAIKHLENGEILGLKGISGYQLVGLPNDEAALKIRQCKGRENKPFAVMFSDVRAVKEYCECNEREEALLKSSARPIVLLTKKKDFPYEVCKESRYIGAFLPSAGIHRLLTDALGPLIVTSANISDEPIIIDDDEFDRTFGNTTVTGVLFHKRKINIPQDDSVLTVTGLSDGSYIDTFIRRSRGYVPLPVFTGEIDTASNNILAFGGDLKNTFSFGKNDRIMPSPYIGDLKDYGSFLNEKKLIAKLEELYCFKPEVLVSDMHPLYESVRLAKYMSKSQNLPLFEVQHHHAHILSVMAEKKLKSCIGVSFDGTGYGTDGKVWGGEFLYCSGYDFIRKGHLSYVKLCGGDNAAKNAQLVRDCYLYASCYDNAVIQPIVKSALDNNIGCFETSSVGRLFDCICALLELKSENSFEGECANILEKKAWEYVQKAEIEKDISTDDYLEEVLNNNSFSKMDIGIGSVNNELIIDQIKLFSDIRERFLSGNHSISELAFSFHVALKDAIIRICSILRDETGESKVCMSGGCFANKLLLKLTVEDLRKNGFDVYTNELVPCTDAGISLGQAYYGMLKMSDNNL